MSKVTLKDIAKETGFSVSKVSRAISGTGAIKEEDQKIILQAAQRLGYKTSVVSSKSDSENLLDRIAVLIPKFNAYLTSDFIQRLNDRLLKNGYVVDYYTVEGSTRPEAELLQFIINKGYKAIIYKPRRVRKDVQAVINTTSTPIFSYGQVYGNCININYDNSRMMYEMTNIAIGAGAKKILYVGTFKDDIEVGSKRFDGFMRAVEEAKLTYHYLECECNINKAYEMARDIEFKQYDAVVTAMDKLSLGIFRYLMESKIIPGKDILLSGVENYDVTNIITPSMTTVELSKASVVDIIIERLTNNDFRPQNLSVPYKIIRRESM